MALLKFDLEIWYPNLVSYMKMSSTSVCAVMGFVMDNAEIKKMDLVKLIVKEIPT